MNRALCFLGQFAEKRCEPLPSTCEACGEEFACGAQAGNCWCAEIKLSDEARASLSVQYERCLCRACLEKLEEQTSEGEG